ncbi:MAG: O-antigen ligase family protein [Marinicaulis sp.]|nr:O-antigen ligase family protein [Marinicaulis sp.]
MTLRERRDKASLILMYGLFAILPLTVVFGHKGVAPWILLASIPAFFRGDYWQSAFGAIFDNAKFDNPVVICFAALCFFCIWIFISGFWSPKHHYGLGWYVMAPALVGGSVIWFSLNISRLWAYRLAFGYALAIICGMAVLAFEGVNGGMLRGVIPPADPSPDRTRDIIALGRGVTALTPALFPAAIILAMIWNRYIALVGLALGVLAAFNNDVQANALAVAAGLLTAIAAFKAPRNTLSAVMWATIVLLIMTPVLMAALPVDSILSAVKENLSVDRQAALSSTFHRLVVWNATANQIIAGLPFGHGADFARIWKETAGQVSVPGIAAPAPVIPLHPHNMYLQIWLELGLPGVLSLALFLFFGGRAFAAKDLPTPVVAAMSGAVTAILVSIMIEGSLWQVWRLAAMSLAGMGVALAYMLHEYGWREDE